MSGTATSTAWYAYAIVGPATPELGRVVESDGLRLQGEGTIGAVVAPVPLAEFGEEELRERLNDRAWLEEKARAHEDVLQRLLGETTVVPLRFGSIHHDLGSVDDLLRQRRDAFERALAAVRGRVEFGVKVWRTRQPADEPAPTTGRGYLEGRLGQRRRESEETAAIEDALRGAHSRFLAHAVDGVVNRPQPRELTGRADDMVLNAAYLVAEDDTSLAVEVRDAGDRHRELGLLFELTGPWPPHNFVDFEDS